MESLNPLVVVETISTLSALEGDALDSLVQAVDLVCVTDWNRDGLVSRGYAPYVRFLLITPYIPHIISLGPYE